MHNQPPPRPGYYQSYQQQAPRYQAQPTRKKSVVAMNIQVLVEVDETESYHDMVEQAKLELGKRVVEARTFLPTRMKSDRIYSDVTVAELKTALVVTPNERWGR